MLANVPDTHVRTTTTLHHELNILFLSISFQRPFVTGACSSHNAAIFWGPTPYYEDQTVKYCQDGHARYGL